MIRTRIPFYPYWVNVDDISFGEKRGYIVERRVDLDGAKYWEKCFVGKGTRVRECTCGCARVRMGVCVYVCVDGSFFLARNRANWKKENAISRMRCLLHSTNTAPGVPKTVAAEVRIFFGPGMIKLLFIRHHRGIHVCAWSLTSTGSYVCLCVRVMCASLNMRVVFMCVCVCCEWACVCVVSEHVCAGYGCTRESKKFESSSS